MASNIETTNPEANQDMYGGLGLVPGSVVDIANGELCIPVGDTNRAAAEAAVAQFAAEIMDGVPEDEIAVDKLTERSAFVLERVVTRNGVIKALRYKPGGKSPAALVEVYAQRHPVL